MISRPRIVATAIILAAALGFPTSTVDAQTAIHLSQLTIRMWPEYDKPGVLVFLVGQTASDVALPVELKFTLPPGSTVNAIAYVDTTNNVLTDKVPQAIDGQTVSITTPNGNFHVEFYDPGLKVSERQRSYQFTWQGNYVVDQLTWELQQPVGATHFNIEPTGGTTITDENGLSVYQLKTTGLVAGKAASLTVSYDKETDILSINALATAQNAATNTPPAASDNSLLPIAAGLAVLVVVIAGVVIYLRGGFAGIGVHVVDAQEEQRERKPRGKSAKKPRTSSTPVQRFCVECGTPARPGDVFCRNCGAKLRG